MEGIYSKPFYDVNIILIPKSDRDIQKKIHTNIFMKLDLKIHNKILGN